jgi:hypothetical protein
LSVPVCRVIKVKHFEIGPGRLLTESCRKLRARWRLGRLDIAAVSMTSSYS